MVEVRFACVPGVPGVKCTLDGAVKYSDDAGLCSFFGISQGAHTYAIEAPAGWVFVSGDDAFGRPLYESGTTVIEWAPYPEIPWPEDQPWMMEMIFQEESPLPTSATIEVSGVATGGFPIPDMELQLVDNGVPEGQNFTLISLGSTYTFTKVVSGAGVHQVYGRMVLTNMLGSYEFTTAVEEIELV